MLMRASGSSAVASFDPPGFVETEDYVEMNGVRIEKPFVEKPASGEDHNVFIYYPYSMVRSVVLCLRCCCVCCLLFAWPARRAF